MIGSVVKVVVDRPLGSFHPKHKDIYYPINYGYIERIIAPDGEEQDASLDTFYFCVRFIRAVYTADITFSLI